jgi:hypothetical protein
MHLSRDVGMKMRAERRVARVWNRGRHRAQGETQAGGVCGFTTVIPPATAGWSGRPNIYLTFYVGDGVAARRKRQIYAA